MKPTRIPHSARNVHRALLRDHAGSFMRGVGLWSNRRAFWRDLTPADWHEYRAPASTERIGNWTGGSPW